MGFSGFVFCVSMAMALAFNLYLADVIIRLRQDIQIIRKKLGAAVVTFPSASPQTAPAEPPAPGGPGVAATDTTAKQKADVE